MDYGSLGLGFGKGFNTNRSNIIDELFDQGVTETKAFSITLAKDDIDQGSLIFGGVDTKKFAGSLYPQPIVAAPDYYFGYNEYRYIQVQMLCSNLR
jgi:Eukaryotic aspartyl protease